MIVEVPLVTIGKAMRGGITFVGEHDIVPRLTAHTSLLQSLGIVAAPAGLGDRTGWGGEVSFNPPYFKYLHAGLAGSTGGYNRGRVELGPSFANIDYESNWRPKDLFFGVGPQSRQEDAATLASQEQRVRLQVRYPFRPPPAVFHNLLSDPADSTDTPDGMRPSLEVWAGPRDVILLNGRERTSKYLPIRERFAPLPAGILDTRVEHFVYGAHAQLDTRAGRPHWWKGWRTGVGVERFDIPIEALAIQSASTPSVAFTRVTYEGEAGVSFWHDPRTLRLYAKAVDQRGQSSGGTFLLTDYASLGGREGLWGFEPGRFHDADLALARLTYIYPLARYFEMDLHAEAGSVEPRLRDLRLNTLKNSYGLAVRVRGPWAPLAFAGVDFSSEKLRLRFGIGGVE